MKPKHDLPLPLPLPLVMPLPLPLLHCRGRRSSQRGMALVGMMVAALIATLAAVWGAAEIQERIRLAGTHAVASWMLVLRDAATAFSVRHGPRIQQADTNPVLPGYVDWTAPTLPELKADGLLPAGFPEQAAFGTRIALRAWRDGLCPHACTMRVLLYTAQPLSSNIAGRDDPALAAQWLMAVQGKGGWVSPAHPDWIRGAAMAWPNPLPDGTLLPVGTVALQAGDAAGSDPDFLRVGDLRDPDFQSQASVGGDMRVGGDVVLAGTLRVGKVIQTYAACPVRGALALNAAAVLQICRQGVWMPASGGGGAFSVNSRYGCRALEGEPTNNPLTGACTCPPAHASVRISDSGDAASMQGRTVGYLCVSS